LEDEKAVPAAPKEDHEAAAAKKQKRVGNARDPSLDEWVNAYIQRSKNADAKPAAEVADEKEAKPKRGKGTPKRSSSRVAASE